MRRSRRRSDRGGSSGHPRDRGAERAVLAGRDDLERSRLGEPFAQVDRAVVVGIGEVRGEIARSVGQHELQVIRAGQRVGRRSRGLHVDRADRGIHATVGVGKRRRRGRGGPVNARVEIGISRIAVGGVVHQIARRRSRRQGGHRADGGAGDVCVAVHQPRRVERHERRPRDRREVAIERVGDVGVLPNEPEDERGLRIDVGSIDAIGVQIVVDLGSQRCRRHAVARERPGDEGLQVAVGHAARAGQVRRRIHVVLGPEGLHRRGQLIQLDFDPALAGAPHGLVHRRRDQGRQDGDDGDDHQHLGQGEGARAGLELVMETSFVSIRKSEFGIRNGKSESVSDG